jgi:hypothetical protein
MIPYRRAGFGLAVAVLLGAAPGAHASTLTVNFPGSFFPTGGDSGTQGYDNSNLVSQPAGDPSAYVGTVLTGGDLLTSGASNLQAYCVDLSHNLYIGSTNLMYSVYADSDATTTSYFAGLYTGANGATTITALEHLASNVLGANLVVNADSSAAFQLAVWDLSFGAGSSGFQATANGPDAATVNADVTSFLNLANVGGAITQRLSLLEDNGMNGSAIQDLVTFSPVPLPGALPLFASGIGLWAVARTRRALRRSAAS